MKIKDYTKAELEAMSYDDIALMILTESNKQMKVNELFKEVCNLLELSEDVFVDKLPAVFDVLSTDHRVIRLENGLWDLKTKHSTKVDIDNDDEDEIETEDIDQEIEEPIEEDEDIYNENEDDEIDDDDDDLKDLVIIDDDDEANGMN